MSILLLESIGSIRKYDIIEKTKHLKQNNLNKGIQMYERKDYGSKGYRWFKDGKMIAKSKVPQEEIDKWENTEEPHEKVEPEETPEVKQDTAVLEDTINTLLRRIEEIEKRSPENRYDSQGTQVEKGKLIGSTAKYSVDSARYPNPISRLENEPRLKRFAFKENYELAYSFNISSYENIDGIRMKEPRFELELHRIVFDEDTGEETNGRYVVCRAVFHEDPDSALWYARKFGLEVDEEDETDFLNEMRYLQMRDWLLEAFYPPKEDETKKNKKEVVIGNKLVDYFETSGENSQSIPFGDLRNKL